MASTVLLLATAGSAGAQVSVIEVDFDILGGCPRNVTVHPDTLQVSWDRKAPQIQWRKRDPTKQGTIVIDWTPAKNELAAGAEWPHLTGLTIGASEPVSKLVSADLAGRSTPPPGARAQWHWTYAVRVTIGADPACAASLDPKIIFDKGGGRRLIDRFVLGVVIGLTVGLVIGYVARRRFFPGRFQLRRP